MVDSIIKVGVVTLIIVVLALIFGSVITNSAQESYCPTDRFYTNLSDNNTNNLYISCDQNATRYFNITNSLDTLGDYYGNLNCTYDSQNVSVAIYYDGRYQDNYTLNCNSTGNITSFRDSQVNVSNGVHNVTYVTNLCYDSPDTNDTISVSIDNNACTPARAVGSQCLYYTNRTATSCVENGSFIVVLWDLLVILLLLAALLYITNKWLNHQ